MLGAAPGRILHLTTRRRARRSRPGTGGCAALRIAEGQRDAAVYAEVQVDIIPVETDSTLEQKQSNCMFQLSLMLARIALEPVSESYKDDMVQALLKLVRTKPKSSVVQMFGATRPTAAEAPLIRASA